MCISKKSLLFFNVVPNKMGTLVPIPSANRDILVQLNNIYYHCYTSIEQFSEGEGEGEYIAITMYDDNATDVEFSDIKKWAYI